MMLNILMEPFDFQVHGRAALFKTFQAWQEGERIDISAKSLFFECSHANLRVALIDDETDVYARKLYLTVEQVERLPSTAAAYIIRDETNPDYPFDWIRGSIQRVGFKGQPDG